MLRKLEYFCLVGAIGLIGADRIDLAAGHLPFILTPFLVLASLVLLLHLLRTPPDQLFRFTITPPIRRQLPFWLRAAFFCVLRLLRFRLVWTLTAAWWPFAICWW